LAKKTFESTWSVKEWNNVNQPDHNQVDYDINNPPFADTVLKKGFFGPGPRLWEIWDVSGKKRPYPGVYCGPLPYSPSPEAPLIILNLDMETLKSLYEEGSNKFKCTYRYYDG